MSSIDTHIGNKLEVLPGNVLLLPGCEPTSAITSYDLLINRNCPKTFIKLSTAIAAIPEARIVFIPNWGDFARKFFILPSGPPPAVGSCCSGPDWYQILKDAAAEEETVTPETCDPNNCCGWTGYMGAMNCEACK